MLETNSDITYDVLGKHNYLIKGILNLWTKCRWVSPLSICYRSLSQLVMFVQN
uniref:Uncharacterized protein n=1 Tax=Arundo donax TaxID=35708 RepID=A0A0A9QIR1_ARUDO